jgi:hypothetical protein
MIRQSFVLTLLALPMVGCLRPGPASGGFERIYERARADARVTVEGEVAGTPVVVHAGPHFDEADARRFLLGLRAYHAETEADYALLRSGLERHLGPELMARIDRRPTLRVPELATTWYLLSGDWPSAFFWTGPPGSSYHIVRQADDSLVPDSKLRYSVHSMTHFLIRSLAETNRAVWPRWLEEGFAEWHRLQFVRMKDGTWDGAADVVARLAWQRGAVRDRLMRWKNPQGIGEIDARLEPEWESDLLYKGALGAVLALDQEVPGGAIGVVKELARVLPRDEAAAVRVVERQLGRPLATLGHLPPQARVALGAGLLAQARNGDLPALAAIGHLPEEAAEVAAVLRSAALRGDHETVIAALTGLRYLGDRRPLERTLEEVEARGSADLLAGLEDDNRFRMAVAYARSGREGDWYARSAPVAAQSETGPGTARPSSSPRTSPTR